MPDRSQPPPIHSTDALCLPRPRRVVLDNGMPVYLLGRASGEVLRIEVVVRAGRTVEHKPLVARATLRQLREGTKRRNASAIAERFDYYGSALRTPFDLDTAQLRVYTLSRHVDEILPVLGEMLAEPAFPEDELQAFARRQRQKLDVELRKPEVVAYREFTALLFGARHPYGYNSSPESYRLLQRADLEKHWRDHYVSGNCFALVSGGIGRGLLKTLNACLGQAIPRGAATDRPPSPAQTLPEQVGIAHPEASQTALRVGRRLFPRRHPDYEEVSILANLLGGYFGSRLMANVREDKGYTYHIYAMTDAQVYDGSLYVATEVGNDVVDRALGEIYAEMRRLREEPVEKRELDMLRNYLLGGYLSALDGPFNQADVIRQQLIDKLPFEAFDEAVDALRTIGPARLQDLAREYLREEDMWEVRVGPGARGRNTKNRPG